MWLCTALCTCRNVAKARALRDDLASFRPLIGEQHSMEGTSHIFKPHCSHRGICWQRIVLDRPNRCPSTGRICVAVRPSSLCCVAPRGASRRLATRMTSLMACHNSADTAQHRQNLLHVSISTSNTVQRPSFPRRPASISCWAAMMRIIPQSERCSHGSPTACGMVAARRGTPADANTPVRVAVQSSIAGVVRPCVNLVVTRFSAAPCP
jgi:hypothetical protein